MGISGLVWQNRLKYMDCNSKKSRKYWALVSSDVFLPFFFPGFSWICELSASMKKQNLYFFGPVLTWHLIAVDVAVKLVIEPSNSYL